MTRYTYEDEIDLRDLIMVVWQGRLWIILAVVVAAAAAFVYGTFMRDREYEATVSFLAPDYPLADGKTLRQADYLPLFRSESIARILVGRHSLAPSDSDVERAVHALLSSIEVKSQANSSVVVVSLRNKDRTVALDILRDYASLVQSEVASWATETNEDYLERVGSAVEVRKSAYHAALDDVRAFRVVSEDLSGLRTLLSDRQSRVLAADKQIYSLESTMESLKASLEQAQSQLTATPQTIIVQDVLDEASVGLLGQHGIGDRTQANAVAIEREQVNPVYTRLLELVYSSQRELDSSEAELGAITKQRSVLNEEIETLRQLLAEVEQQDARLSAAVERAKTEYDTVVSRYSTALSAVNGIDYKIAVVNGPIASISPVGPGRLTIMALAVVLVGFVSVFGVLFAEYMRSGERRAVPPPADTVAQ